MPSTAVDLNGVLDVPVDEQRVYAQTSYRDYLRTWRLLRRSLEVARTSGDIESEARVARELRHLWPRPEAVARVAGFLRVVD